MGQYYCQSKSAERGPSTCDIYIKTHKEDRRARGNVKDFTEI